ncbi:MAG: PTS mannose transporter subunit IIA [Gammaproteobacteria bacterium]|jgi:PTS system ascorbate-specific IIA component
MNISVLLITHANMGKSLLNELKNTFEKLPLTFVASNIKQHENPETLIDQLNKKIKQLDKGDGILILTDLYGSTPSNIAYALKKRCSNNIRIISGVNLPMLVTIVNYANLPLDKMVTKVIRGGKKGIIDDQHLPYE